MRVNVNIIAVTTAGLVAAVACAGPSGKVMSSDAETVTDSRRAGIVAYDTIAASAITDLVRQHEGMAPAVDHWVAFVGIENRSSEELGEFREALYEDIDTALIHSGLYRVVSRRAVEAGLRSSGIGGPSALLTADSRAAFLETLGTQGAFPEFLLFAKVTTKTSRSGSTVDRAYRLSLELVDAVTGEVAARSESEEFRKRYRR